MIGQGGLRDITKKGMVARMKLMRLMESKRKRRRKKKGEGPYPQVANMPNSAQTSKIPPMEGNPFSPTEGKGMDNLHNTIKNNRPDLY